MANFFYPKGAEAVLNGQINFGADSIMAALVDTDDYTYNSAHDFFDDLAGVIDIVPLASITRTNGVLDAANPTFTTVAGDEAELIVIFKDTGTAGTSPLLLHIDDATGLPVTPNGGDITIEWNASGILTLA
ncbi:bacteriophage protein [Allostella sp. ATCC 35155]|nr:bacteriophage protein [Stella sp. ATCC 35155]